jgi:hypothetical protein
LYQTALITHLNKNETALLCSPQFHFELLTRHEQKGFLGGMIFKGMNSIPLTNHSADPSGSRKEAIFRKWPPASVSPILRTPNGVPSFRWHGYWRVSEIALHQGSYDK